MGLARAQSQRLNHEYIGTEHLLLGLVQEGGGVAVNVLKRLGIDLRKVRQEVEALVKPGPTEVTMGQVPFTHGVKTVLELALDEAASLSHKHLGTEHLLLGLIREGEGTAAKVLARLNAGLEIVRREVARDVGEQRS
jgi:ATP-dependent Clp protease ATP-binding subunit ClpC